MSELKLQQTSLDGRYVVAESLARGSYAEIYVTRDEAAAAGQQKMVVIKALNVSMQGAIDPELKTTLIDNVRNEAAAPQHHPLMQTGPLATATLSTAPKQLTPAADIYSLAKTAYMMLTGEAPRRFSQQPITDLPAHVAAAPWAAFVLHVLRRATETN